ncbi:MAG: hypothetical protein ABSG03_30790 [Bryobacteraceae bacterium]|jgi:hypothetical protein
MRDWKAIAKASGSPLTGKDLDALILPLEALEATFRPLTKDLSPDLDPSVEFRMEADVE